ncbi:FAD-dependent oxidoreductase [Candidatus Gottesmanbacteria bacterium]|nr:FAD-dependent oxidoreductase [Candidatus Gottesmanbacteria bacterium]
MVDVVIIGSGPAGLTAAIYCQRFGLSTVVIAGRKWGGQLMLTTDVENYPGFRHILGPELMQKMRDQTKDLGVEIVDLSVTKLDTSKKPFLVTAEDKTFEGKTVIIATGADTKWLGVPNEGKLRGHGLSSCAPCDAFFFKGKPVAVVGGGDSAMEEAQVIAKVASDVILIHRRDEFRAQKAMIDKVMSLKNIRVLYNTQVMDVIGDTTLTGVLLDTRVISPKQGVASFDELVVAFSGVKKTNTQWELPRLGLFVAIGLVPNTQIFQGLELDSHGYVKRYEEKDENGVLKYFTKTNVPGVFTAGDVHDARYKQAVTAAGFGCMAALDVQRWLAEQEK